MQGRCITNFHLPKTKATPQGEDINWAKQDGPSDPKHTLSNHISINSPALNSPLFTYRDGLKNLLKPLTRSKFLMTLSLHQQFVECLKCLGQTMSGMSDTSGVPDPCLNSGAFLSGSGIIVWSLSGHSLFSTHQTPSRYTTDIYYRFFSAYSVWSQVYSALVRQQPDTPQTCITGSSSLFSSSQTIPDTGSNNQMKYIIGWLIGIISTVVYYYYSPGSNFVEGSPLETPLPGRPTENTANIS